MHSGSSLPYLISKPKGRVKPKYISHMAQYLRLLLPSPSSSPIYPCDIASVQHRRLQQFIFFNVKTNAKIPNVTIILVPICFLGSKKQIAPTIIYTNKIDWFRYRFAYAKSNFQQADQVFLGSILAGVGLSYSNILSPFHNNIQN